MQGRMTHVVGTRSRVVSEPDSEVLNLKGLLLVDLLNMSARTVFPSSSKRSTYDVEGNDLTVSLLGLLQLTKVVPVSGLGDDLVGGEDPHAAAKTVKCTLWRNKNLRTRAWEQGPPR